MSTRCPSARDLGRLLDGELTENRAAELRDHLRACPGCSAELDAQRRLVGFVSADIPGSPGDGAVEAVMRRLEVAADPAGRPVTRPRLRQVLAALATASALASLAIVLHSRGTRDEGEFSARGAAVTWARKIGVEVWALEDAPRRLGAGDRLASGVPLVVSFSNVDPAPAYLLAFALDDRGEVHWVYPAFLDPRDDPASVRLDASVVQRTLPEAVTLEDVPAGSLRFVLVVTRDPLRVSSIESAPPSARAPDALRARWPEARVDELPVTFGPALSPVP